MKYWYIMSDVDNDEEIITGPFETEAEAQAWCANNDPAYWTALGAKREDCYVKAATRVSLTSLKDIL